MPELVDRFPSQQTQEPSDWWVGFVAHWKNQGFRKRKEWPPRISFGLQSRFRYLPARTTDVTTLIRKSSESCSPHPSRSRFLDDHCDPKIPSIRGVRIKLHVSGKPCGFIYCSDPDEASQNRNVLQRSSSDFSPAYVGFVTVIRYRDEETR